MKALLGPTAEIGGQFEFIKGIVADSAGPDKHRVSILQKCDAILTACIGGPLDTTPVQFDRAAPAAQEADDTARSSAIGHYLVRDGVTIATPVPVTEPGTLAVLAAGLGMACLRRRRSPAPAATG